MIIIGLGSGIRNRYIYRNEIFYQLYKTQNSTKFRGCRSKTSYYPPWDMHMSYYHDNPYRDMERMSSPKEIVGISLILFLDSLTFSDRCHSSFSNLFQLHFTNSTSNCNILFLFIVASQDEDCLLVLKRMVVVWPTLTQSHLSQSPNSMEQLFCIPRQIPTPFLEIK